VTKLRSTGSRVTRLLSLPMRGCSGKPEVNRSRVTGRLDRTLFILRSQARIASFLQTDRALFQLFSSTGPRFSILRRLVPRLKRRRSFSFRSPGRRLARRLRGRFKRRVNNLKYLSRDQQSLPVTNSGAPCPLQTGSNSGTRASLESPIQSNFMPHGVTLLRSRSGARSSSCKVRVPEYRVL
jgi:hypothetical protein